MRIIKIIVSMLLFLIVIAVFNRTIRFNNLDHSNRKIISFSNLPDSVQSIFIDVLVRGGLNSSNGGNLLYPGYIYAVNSFDSVSCSLPDLTTSTGDLLMYGCSGPQKLDRGIR